MEIKNYNEKAMIIKEFFMILLDNSSPSKELSKKYYKIPYHEVRYIAQFFVKEKTLEDKKKQKGRTWADVVKGK